MKHVIIAGIGVVLIAVGWFAYSHYQVPSALIENDELVLSASFMCDDGTHFIASFPTNESVEVISDDETVYTLPLVEGADQRFEDSRFVYLFAGEEVTVTNKTAHTTTSCHQPIDANNAPVNFGDRGEGAGETQDISPAVRSNIIGIWQSTDDAKFTRTFSADGLVTDAYNGVADTPGTWSAYSSDTGMPYIRIVMNGETLEFSVGAVTPEALELTYLARGNTLQFTRIAN